MKRSFSLLCSAITAGLLLVACNGAKSYTVSVSVTGLDPGQQVTLLKNGTDSLTLGANTGQVSFPGLIAEGGKYVVTVSTQPANELCTVNGGTGAGVYSNVSVSVTCSRNTYSISGQVSGLGNGQTLVLADNGADPKTIAGTGASPLAFTFASEVAYLGSYNVTVLTQPTNQTCSPSANTGTGAGINAAITSIVIVCSPNNYSISGTVTGLLSGQHLTLYNNGGDALALTGSGGDTTAFTFATPVAYLGSYTVTVNQSPENQTCSPSGNTASGAGINGAISTVAFTCSPNRYSIGGTVTGLLTNQQLTLYNNGADALTLSGSNATVTPFTFTTQVSYLGSYGITVNQNPQNETCSPLGNTASGAGITGTVSSVAFTCSPDHYRIGGTITGLVSGQTITLYNNGADALSITGGGSGTDVFTFAKPVAYLGGYTVTVNQNPTNQTCSPSGNTASGAGINRTISSVAITCSRNNYTIGGSVAGLLQGQQLTLYNNGADALSITGGASGTNTFTFLTSVAYLGSYSVTVSQKPQNETCSVATNASGTNSVSANITSVGVTCSLDNYRIGGSITGLASGQTVTLQNNLSNATNVTGGGTGSDRFEFSIAVAYQGGYSVSVSTPPAGAACSVSGGSGTAIAAVSNVAVACHATFTAGVRGF